MGTPESTRRNVGPASPGVAAGVAPRRVFLGWDGSSLARAARWLLEQHHDAMGGVVVALPGARAGRRLEELLVAGAGPAFHPPAIVTAGHLTDRLLLPALPRAGRMARTLLWTEVLRRASPAALAPVVRQPPASADLPGWVALAETLRELHGELAADDLDFEDAAQSVAEHPGGREAERWRSLAGLQRDYLARVAAQGLADPHDARRRALAQDGLAPGWRELHVVLVGVVELNGLLARLVDRVGERVTALVFAPETRAADFDARGGVLPERWREADVPLPLARWSVVDKPADQAERVVSILAGWGGRFAVDEIAIGVPDADVAPYVERRLAESGAASRQGSGRRLADTAPCRLLAAVSDFLAGRGSSAFAALVRHPDVHALLLRGASSQDPDPLALLDDYQAEHLPERIGEPWLDGRTPTAPLRRAHRVVLDALGDLAAPAARPLPQWAPPVRAFLQAVCGGAPLDRDADETHDRLAAFEALAELLAEIESLPTGLAAGSPATAADALALLLRAAAGRAVPPSGRQPAIELLGWLELPLDDAPGLVITGFNDGRLPDSVRAGAFLPQGLRRRLRMTDDERRVARDVYALSLALHSRPETHLITARRSVRDDPLLPSRFAFHVPAAQAVERVRHWLPPEDGSRAPGGRGPPAAPPARPPGPRAPARALPRVPIATPTALSVTAFRQYLRSPYLFYLQNVLGLQGVDDGARELDPLAFGLLAHAVLEAFGRDAVRDATDAAAIEAFLDRALDRELAARYGREPLPAVRLQAEQLRRRLQNFARWQAGHRRDGWRIAHVEWRPEQDVVLDVDGQPIGLHGKIDRIDVHESTGQWAILDYKTSEQRKARDRLPRATHGPRPDGRWEDLQLPLYAVVAGALGASLRGAQGEPLLGYVALPQEADAAGLLEADWTAGELLEALEAARDVVRRIRHGEFFDLGDFPRRDPLLGAITGRGLLSALADEDGEQGDGDGDGSGDGDGDGSGNGNGNGHGNGDGDGPGHGGGDGAGGDAGGGGLGSGRGT